MRQLTLDFLSAYHPRYLCPACLAQLMIDFEVGVATARTYQVKRVDSDYFEEA